MALVFEVVETFAGFAMTSPPTSSPPSAVPLVAPGAAPGASVGMLPGWPVLRLGFRPFYLLTALLACVSVPLWVLMFAGHAALPLPLPGLLWHGHEMLFGFAAGVVMGFLLTAVRAWTGLDTARGPLLGVLALLWLVPRLAVWVVPYPVFAAIDMVLLPVVALVLLRVLLRAGNKRNVPLVGLLGLMALANGAFHLSVLEVLAVSALSALYAQLGLIVMVVCVITGRVVPMFTKNVTPGLVIQAAPKLERAVLVATALALLLWVLGAPGGLAAPVSLVAAALHAQRLWRWQPQVTLTRPILWVLHLSYVWLPVAFVLLALAQLGWLAPSLAVHAFGVGVMGGLIIGMVTRTARGHTGRMLQVGRAEVCAYVCVLLAAVVRVLLPALWPAAYVRALDVAALLWALAFALYLWVYTPWLLRTRLDGKDG